MHVDFDLMRDLLIMLERGDTDDHGVNVHPDPEDCARSLHLRLLLEAGMLQQGDGFVCENRLRLSWAGHEYLSAVRDPAVWGTIKGQQRSGCAMSVTAVRDLARAITRRAVRELGEFAP
jgi:hypothetical protein